MLYIEPEGGLCNRMRAIACGFELSRMCGSKMKVLWKKYYGLNCGFDEIFMKNMDYDVVEIPEDSHILESYQHSCEHQYIDLTTTKITELKKIKEELSNGENVYIGTCLDFIDGVGFHMLRFVEDIERKILDVMAPAMGGYIVGVHIRRTDCTWAIQNSPTELFIECMDKEISENTETKFFVSTDSAAEEKALLDRYGERIIVQDGKMLNRNSKEGIIDAAVDLGCLSRCSKIYGSFGSSFSQTAARLNGKELIYVKIKQEESFKYLFPFDLVDKNAKIAIYGAGRVGQDYRDCLYQCRYASVVVWVDKKYRQIRSPYGDVKRVETLLFEDYDAILIAVAAENVAEEIKAELISIGIAEDKILWKKPAVSRRTMQYYG